MSDNKPLTIGEILEMQPGSRGNATWIDGDFECIIRHAQEGRGGKTRWWRAELHDPHDEGIKIGYTGDLDVVRYEGKLVRFSGKGIKRDEYKQEPIVRCSDKAMINLIGTPVKGTPTKPGSSTSTEDSGAGIYGPTVGNALTLAVESVNRDPNLVAGTPAWALRVWEVASDIIRLNKLLAEGNLAETAKVRANPELAAKKKAEAEAAAAAKAKAEAEAKAQAEAEAAARAAAASSSGAVTTVGGRNLDEEDVPF